MKRYVYLLSLLILLLLPFQVWANEGGDDIGIDEEVSEISADEQQPGKSQLLFEGLARPQAMVMGDSGEIYILDGIELKKYQNGQLTTVANLTASRNYFAPYGLGEIEDLYTFRAGSMVYLNGAVYVAGLIVDRLIPPKPYGEWHYGMNDYPQRQIGYAMPIIIKITDHFEPLVVDEHAKQSLELGLWELQGLMRGDPAYTQDWMYMDYTTRFRNLYIPNLTKSPDGALYVIKQSATKYVGAIDNPPTIMYEDGIIVTDKRVGKLYNNFPEVKKILSAWNHGLYKVWPDGRTEMLDETLIIWKQQAQNQKHLSDFVTTYNRYLLTINDPYPDNNLIYAVPSVTDPENSVIITNGHYLWKYNFKNVTYSVLDFVPGNEMPSGNRYFLIPQITYSPTMPRTTRTLGTFFLGRGDPYEGNGKRKAVFWRLYADRFYQDFGRIDMPWIDETVDWSIDEDNRLIYYVTRDGKLYKLSFAHLIPQATNTTENDTVASPVPVFKAMFDQNYQTYYWSNSQPFYRNGELYVHAGPILSLVNIEVEDTPSETNIKLRYRTYGNQTYLECIKKVLPDGNTYAFSTPDRIVKAIYELTGQRYKLRYDPATNIIYLESDPSAISIFNGRWW